MTDKELRKKLRKKAKKLAKWGKRHGIPYASMFYMVDGYQSNFYMVDGYQSNSDFIYAYGVTDDGAKVRYSGFLGDEDE